MKKILVLTDFSTNATHAATCGLEVAIRLKTDILLYHTYPALPVAPVFTGGDIITETAEVIVNEATQYLLDLQEKLLELLKVRQPVFFPIITVLSDSGPLDINISHLQKKEMIEMVIMGARQGSALSHLLEGSDTRTVIEASSRPVLVVPPKATCSWSKILLATAFRPEDFAAINCLLEWKAAADIKLDIAHVDEIGKSDVASAIREIPFREKMDRLNEHQQLSYYDVRGRDVGGRLIRLCRQENVSILALIHYRRDLLSRLTGKSKTLRALTDQHLPLLVFPPELSLYV